MQSKYTLYEGAKTIRSSVGSNSILGQDTFIEDSQIGRYVQINRRNIISNCIINDYTYTGANTILKHAIIGKYCSISWNVSASGNIHEYTFLSTHPFHHFGSFGFVEKSTPLNYETITIGNDVWIGANVSIMPGVKISDGAIIGSGGVVTHDIPPYAIAAGNPARVIKNRFPKDVCDALLSIKWWEYPEEYIRANIELFKKPVTNDILDRLRTHNKL